MNFMDWVFRQRGDEALVDRMQSVSAFTPGWYRILGSNDQFSGYSFVCTCGTEYLLTTEKLIRNPRITCCAKDARGRTVATDPDSWLAEKKLKELPVRRYAPPRSATRYEDTWNAPQTDDRGGVSYTRGNPGGLF
jgi:hypothetical protein